MSNTVRRPRRHPRKRSLAWKSFGWLLRRTALLASVFPDADIPAGAPVREWLAAWDSAHFARIAHHALASARASRTVYTFRG